MKVARWGNGLAVRLPKDLVDAMDLKEGDELVLRSSGERIVGVSVDRERADFRARFEALSRPMAPGLGVNRDEINDRFGPASLGRVPYHDER